MKKIGWFFFVISIGIVGYFLYFYHFKYVPEINRLQVLMEENRVLRDSLLKVLPVGKMEVRKAEKSFNLPYEVKYKIEDFFVKNSERLSDNAKRRLGEISRSLSVIPYDTVEVILFPGGQLQINRALTIKRELISQGLMEEKVFARVTKYGEKGLIIIKVK
ncbi:MAG: hypothetical protein QMD82_02595 [bacterium]|nr:hypothetical protein [bacterium]